MKILLVPSIRASMGSGHLKRALALVEIFGPESALLLEGSETLLGSGAAGSDNGAGLRRLGMDSSPCRTLERYDARESWDLVIVDQRSTPVRRMSRFFPVPVLGLDEGGPARAFCSYLIDTLPAYRQRHAPNLSSLSLLNLPERTARPVFPPKNVLISFGGEDPAELSGALLKVLLKKRYFEGGHITVVQGPYFKRTQWPKSVTVMCNPGDLKSLLAGYDLLFCSFGLTAFEALAAGVPVINFNPSAYHRRLSIIAGIPEIGVRRPSIRRLERLLERPDPLGRLLSRYPAERFSGSLQPHDLPRRLHCTTPARCPVCEAQAHRAEARFIGRSYFRCRSCGVLYMLAFGQRPVAYDEKYFFQEYRRQYGRSYLEDFPAIKAAAAGRLKHILRFDGKRSVSSPNRHGRLLDVGCAYGPFLQAASEMGYRVQGLDVSEEAVRYVRGRLGFPCALGDFDAPDGVGEITSGGRRFSVITMWYVIEHFRNTREVLERINRLLEPGGVLAFSTPSAAGISARKDRIRFLKQSPEDHYTVWSPRITAGILERFGFRLRKIVFTGHHGERFPWPKPLSPDSGVALGLARLSRLFGLGDTYEAYAVKVRELT